MDANLITTLTWCGSCLVTGFIAGFNYGKYVVKNKDNTEVMQYMKCHIKHPDIYPYDTYDEHHKFIKFSTYMIKNKIVRISCNYMLADKTCIKSNEKCSYLHLQK